VRRPSPTSAKRWTLKVALVGVCMLAGAVATWGVAWGCALWAPRTAIRSHPGGAWPAEVPADWPPPGIEVSSRGPGTFSYVWENSGYILRESQDGTRTVLTTPTVRQYTIRRFRAGWPAFALRLERRSGQHGPISTGVLRVLESQTANANIPGLPTRILPLGFALNTLFYAAVLLGIVEGPAFARRRVRRGRGRCPSCGYDRAGLAEGSACPECGGKA
jgi:hypothetical protein